MTPTTDELRALVERLEINPRGFTHNDRAALRVAIKDREEAAAAIRQWIAERERDAVTHEWCGDDPVQRLPPEFEKAIFDDVERLYEK